MPKFVYKASDLSGKVLEGVIEGDNQELVLEKLKGLDYLPLEVREEKVKFNILSFPFQRIRRRDIMSFTQQLSSLVGAGMPLDKGLSILEKLTKNKRLKIIISDLKEGIQKGGSFSDALSHHIIFSKLYVNMVRVGEASGELELILQRLAEFTEREEELKGYIRSIMVYPTILTIFGVFAVVFLLTFVIPRFIKIFEGMEQTLPLPTLILISISNMIVKYWWLILGSVLLVFFAFRAYINSKKGGLLFDRFKLKIPILGTLLKKIIIDRLIRNFVTLISGGVPLIQALAIVKDNVGNKVVSQDIEEIQQSVKEGKGISSPLKRSKIFPDLVSHMVEVGEETGRLEEVLNKVATIYDREIKDSVRGMISLIEPVIILAMGVIVGFIVASVLLPIFEMSELPF